MRLIAVIVASLIFLMVGCQPSPPTVVYVVVTPTQETPTNAPPSPTPLPSPTMRSSTITETPRVIPTVESTSVLVDTPSVFPTETIAQIQVAEQVYERGRMVWLQPVSQIWVMIVDEEGRGRWLRYEDTFTEGEDPEIDESLNVPEGLLQPERGFGKLWRENPEIRDALGWAITPEFGYISQYEYHPAGSVEEGNEPGYGHHILFSLNGEAFRFDEATNTWALD